ncbi:hypothetical protein FGRMN_2323 [Fusarium graminum]|nr:hypothetical protein FGRMN_2323 [Fusarium graminum]
MKRQVAAFALLGGIAKAIASADLNNVKYEDQGPGTYCITYLSTYLAPVSMGTELPEPSQNSTEPGQAATSDIISELVTTQLSSAPGSQSTSVNFNPTGQRIIFAVTPSESRKRDVGGFVGNGNPDVCTFATVFTLGNGRLFEGGLPISYLGDAFQLLQSSSVPSSDDITTTFSGDGGSLRFANPGLPGGEASFCQTSSDGQVYITFTSQPQGCVPVRLTIYGAERCINGRIDGLDTSTAINGESTQALEPLSTSLLPPNPTDEESIFPTMTIDPTRPLTFSNFTTRQSTADIPAFTSGIIFPSLPPSRSDEPSLVETETLAPTFVTSEEVQSSFEIGKTVLGSTTALPVLESSSFIVLPSSSLFTFVTDEPESYSSTTLLPSVLSTTTSGEASSSTDILPTSTLFTSSVDQTSSTLIESSSTVLSSSEASSSTFLSSSDIPSSTLLSSSEASSLTESSETSTLLTTSFESTTQDPTTTTTMETTTTTEEVIIITNRVANGRFAMPDPNSNNGIMGFETEGAATHRNGDCFSGDGGTDNGCVVLETVNGRKRGIGSFAGISQMLASMIPSRTVLYTVQFYYAVITVGSEACTIDAYLGNRQVYSQGLFNGGGISISWNRVLTTVRADSSSANFGISMSCSGNGAAMIYVDSVFVSNQVTPDNIDDHQLEFGDAESPPQQSTPGLIDSTTKDEWLPSSTALISDSTSSWLTPHQSDESTPSIEYFTSSSEASSADQSDETTPSVSTTQDPTTTSQTSSASETPTETCNYTHGEECEFDRFNYPHDALCAYGAEFKGETWKESRTDYPHQNNPYQCIAICKSLGNCESVGYFANENRCLFTSTRITENDFTVYGNSEDWKHSYWVDKRCWTCPDCVDESVPNTPPGKCSYTQGDACTRNAAPEGVVCNTNAYMPGGYWTGEQWIDQYPHQDSSEACAAICHGIADCKGSAFKDGECKFSAFLLSTTDGPIPLQLDRDESWNSLWDDPSCFTCPGCTD